MILDQVEVRCYKCATSFGMSSGVYNQRSQDQRDFWCPNGHKQHFTGPSKAQKKIDKLELEKLRLQESIEYLRSERREQLNEHKFKCPMAHCTWGTNVKLRMRNHLERTHNMRALTALLSAEAGADATGDMGIH